MSGPPVDSYIHEELKALKQQRHEHSQRANTAEQALAALQDQHNSLRSLMALRAARIAELERTIEERDRNLASAQRRLGEQLSTQRGLEHKLQTRLTELAESREQVSALSRRLEEMSATVEQLHERLEQAAQQSPPTSAVSSQTPTLASPQTEPGDDLTKIHGIGPKFARALEQLGVRSFSEIAGWSDDDVERVAKALKIRPSRITKRDWRLSAAELMKQDA